MDITSPCGLAVRRCWCWRPMARFGAGLVNTLAMTQLEREAAPLIAEFDRQLENDAAYLDLLAEAADAEADALEARDAISQARDTGLDPQDFQSALARQTTRLTEIGAQLEQRRSEIVRSVAARAPSSEAGIRARAGFEYWISPRERRQLFLADARAIAFGGRAGQPQHAGTARRGAGHASGGRHVPLRRRRRGAGAGGRRAGLGALAGEGVLPGAQPRGIGDQRDADDRLADRHPDHAGHRVLAFV